MDPGSPSRAAPIVRSFLTRSDSGTPNDSNVFPLPSARPGMGSEQGMMSRGNDPPRLATKTTHRFPATTYNTYNCLCEALQTLD